MADYADLEIGLHRRELGYYAIEFRFSTPDSDVDVGIGQAQPTQFILDPAELIQLNDDPAAYGQKLSAFFFAEPVVQSAFAQARASVQSRDAPLRVRLMIGPSAPELHSLRWETLQDPQDGSPLFTGENLFFSRYLSSVDWRPVRLRSKGQLRALVVVSNPSDMADYDLGPIDVAREIERAERAIDPIPVTALRGGEGIRRPTLNNLIDHLREVDYDIIYLVCHGSLVREEAWLWLEDEQGKAARASGTELVTRFKELLERPRLVVLASCESAGAGTGQALAALGPRLAASGIPAVLAMQGRISTQTVSDFMPVFFRELQRDGRIDRAVAVARGGVRQQPDHWMPALFMRLKSGRIWYTPGFGGDFEKWPAILRSIKRSECTPILGPGLYEKLLGSPREIALRWAEQYNYPLEPHGRESLPQVAQFLTVNQYQAAPLDALEDTLIQEIHKRLDDNAEIAGNENLDQLMEIAGSTLRRSDPLDPYRVLAELPLPIYITTNLNNLLASALREANKDPQVVLCPWNDDVKMIESVYDTEPGYLPTIDRPLVYHLFGRLSQPESVVLTEDHYFDFLIGVTRNSDLIRPEVRGALAASALLFLGFHIDDWQFRVLFRSIISQQEGRYKRGRYPHIAVQIEPEEDRLLEPERARQFLEDYYFQGAEISLYWGNVEDFVGELQPRWQASPA